MEAEAPTYEGDEHQTGTQARTPVNGHTVRVGTARNDPVDLYYQLHGRGPHKVLLIMGFATSCLAWMPNVDQLVAQHGDELEVCIFDNRGCGRSSCPETKFSTSIMASDAQDLLDHLQWSKVHVVGISMGGMISQELALLLVPQERLASLALAVTHAGGLYATAPMAGILGMLSSMLKTNAEEKADVLLRLIYSDTFLAAPCSFDPSITWKDYCRANFIERVRTEPRMTPRALAGHIRCVTTHHVSRHRLAVLRNSGVPIVIMTGTIDALVRPKNSHLLAKELNPVEFHVWEGAGHAVNMECLDKFNEVIVRNFRRGAGEADQRSGEGSRQDELHHHHQYHHESEEPARHQENGEEKAVEPPAQPHAASPTEGQ